MSGLVTPLVHSVQSEKFTSSLITSGMLRIIRKSVVIGVFRDVIHIIYHGVLVNNQLDAQFFFRVYLFQFSTSFQHPCAHHQENQLY